MSSGTNIKGKTGYICKSCRRHLSEKNISFLSKGEIRFVPFRKKEIRFAYMSATSTKLQIYLIFLYCEVADIHFRDCPCLEPGLSLEFQGIIKTFLHKYSKFFWCPMLLISSYIFPSIKKHSNAIDSSNKNKASWFSAYLYITMRIARAFARLVLEIQNLACHCILI